VKYRIADLGAYNTAYREPRLILKTLAEREMNRYFVTRDIDTLLSSGRAEIGRLIRQRLQAEVDRRKLGLEVVFVGLQTIHPPMEQEVAAKFQEQIDAQQEKQSAINRARKEAVATLAQVAGSNDRAVAIDQAILRLAELTDELEQLRGEEEYDPDAARRLGEQITSQELRVENLLDEAGGKAAQTVQEARAYRWQTAVSAAAEARAFSAELDAYEEAPSYYRTRRYFEILTEGLANQRKFIIGPGIEADDPAIIRLDLKTGKIVDPVAEEE